MNKPNPPIRVFDGIHWIGAMNPSLRRCDAAIGTPSGTGYNAYLILGAEKTAVVGSVKGNFLSRSLDSLRQIMDPARMDYLVLPHVDPDHAGAIRALMAAAPKAQILCSETAALYLPHIVNKKLPIETVKDGDILDLGGLRRLHFLAAPFLPWPDSMFVYEERSKGLFTGKAFSCHHATEGIHASRLPEDLLPARRLYYDHLMRPFAPYVRRAVAHVRERGFELSALLPAHGPVIDGDPAAMLALYEEWAREEPHLAGNRVFIGYMSCYGYTRQMAKRLRDRTLKLGLVPELVDLAECPLENARTLLSASDAIAIGCPTVNGDAPPPVWNLLTALSVPMLRGRRAAVFGSYGWSGEAAALISHRLAALGCKAVGEPVLVRFRPTAADMERMDGLGDEIAAGLRAMQGV